MDQFLLLLLFGLIALIQWVIKKSAELREQRKAERRAQEGGEPLYRQQPEESAPSRAPSGPVDESAEAMRRLREALGLPEDDPEPVVRRTPPPVFQPPPLPPPLPPPEPVRRRVITPPPVAVEPPPSLPMVTLSSVRGKASAAPAMAPVSSGPRVRPRVRELLSSPGGLQDAVVLTEILGRPKGAQI